MDHILSIFLILGTLSKMNSDNVEETRENPPTAFNSAEKQTTNITKSVGVPIINAELPSQTLPKLEEIAKNISHSKGIYRQSDGKSDNDLEIRRSILRKATVVSESDTMKTILQAFESNENKLLLLEEIEYMVHQYDVAVQFATLGGIEIITSYLFSSDDKIVSSAASVLGSAMQSNPIVQKLAMKQNVERNLLKLLSHESPDVLSRIIFALASLLRNAPEAQKEFLFVEGVSKLADLLKHHKIATHKELKIINLLNDLAVELGTTDLYQNYWNSHQINEIKRLFAHQIQKSNVCKLIPSYLYFEGVDTHQKIVSAMISLHSVCHKDFKEIAIDNRLSDLLQIYDPESDSQNPMYSNIDIEFKKNLYSELKILFEKNNEKITKIASNSIVKIEL